MGYYLNVAGYKVAIIALGAFVFIFLMFQITLGLTTIASRKFMLTARRTSVLISFSIFASAIITYFALIYIPDYINDGKIHRVYFLKDGTKDRLVVWFTRVDHPAGVGTEYSHRLKSYDFKTGKQLGRQNLARRYYCNNYRIFGPFEDNSAWGFTSQNGLKLINLAEPKVLASEEQILKQNPELGNVIFLVQHNVFDPVTHGLYVSTNKGVIFRIDPDLKAAAKKDIPESNRFFQRKPLTVNRRKWVFNKQAGSQKKTIHAYGVNLTQDAKGLLSPKIVPRWDDELLSQDKIWVMHWQDLSRKPNCLLSYMDADGRELKQINVQDLFKKYTEPYSVALQNGEMYIFMSREGYTLSALQVASESGTVLHRIDYF